MRVTIRDCSVMRCLVAVALLAAPACSSDDAERSRVRDSAGIRIAENPAGAAARAAVWVIDSASTTAIGDVARGPAHELFRVVGVARLSDGRVAVLNAGSNDLRFFDQRGEHLLTVGRKGDGPGEFQSAAALVHLANDSLAVWDRSQQRVTVFSPAGDYIRTVRLDVGGNTTEVLGAFADGSVGIAMLRLQVPRSGFTTCVASIASFPLDGSILDTLATVPWREVGILYPGDDIIGSRTFAPRTAGAIHGDRLWIGTAVDAQIEMRDRRGTLAGIVRWDAGDRSVGPGDAAAFFEAAGPGAPPDRQRALSIPVMDRYPAHGRLIADAGGNMWVERYPRPMSTDPTPWLIFEREGRLIGRADVPPDLRIFEIGENAVVGVRRDAEGVERVSVHRLRRPGV